MEDGEWSGPTTRPYTQRKKKTEKSPANAQEKETVYYGDESFMNAIHPNEVNGKKNVKRSSPMQRAIIDCISRNGGKATETQILEYITEKWEIINKYSERGVLVEPNIRVVRLNCAVKKKGRHLFVQSPNDPETWMFNISSRRNIKETHPQNDSSSNDMSSSAENRDKPQFDSQTEEIDITFEKCILNCFKEADAYVPFASICEYMRKYSNLKGLFNRLPFERRVKACLIYLKKDNKIQETYQSNKWFYTLIV